MSKPLSKEFLLSRKKCCKHGCQNCPYGYNKNKNMSDNKLKYEDKGLNWDTYQEIYPFIKDLSADKLYKLCNTIEMLIEAKSKAGSIEVLDKKLLNNFK